MPQPYLFVILASLIALSSCSSTQQDIDRRVRLFDELAFGGPFDNDLRQGRALVKWAGAIRVSVTGDHAGQFVPEVTRQLEKISKLTRLSIRVEESPTEYTNYLIKFSTDRGYSIRKDFVPCIARLGISAGVINKARIEISTVNKDLIRRCIAHEAMHSFGFRYHSGIARSILSPAHGEQDLTRLDELMLATLYDDDLPPGTSRAEALASARRLIGVSLTK